MAFSKRFPRTDSKGFTVWEEITLSDAEEQEMEAVSRKENIELFKECLKDAAALMKEQGLKDFQTNLVAIATELFEKRASHTVYWKENKCKEKFDAKFG